MPHQVNCDESGQLWHRYRTSRTSTLRQSSAPDRSRTRRAATAPVQVSDATPPADADVGDADALRGAAGPGYAGEWGLFCDYTRAADQPALPTTVAALTGFLAALPARPATVARRVRAIAAAHRRAGYLLTRPEHGPAALGLPRSAQWRRPEPELMIAACATRGWPAGLPGRRDAFLIVLTETLGYPHRAARALSPADITEPSAGPTGEAAPRLAGRAIPSGSDPRSCPACALVRWLDILGVADAPTPTGPHQHTGSEPARWRAAAVLLPAIDQHGWLDDYRPISTRTIRTRLAHASGRAGTDDLLTERPDTPPAATDRPRHPGPVGGALRLLLGGRHPRQHPPRRAHAVPAGADRGPRGWP